MHNSLLAIMNSSSENIPSQVQNSGSPSSDSEPIKDLINLLLNQEPSLEENNLDNELNSPLELNSQLNSNGAGSPYPDIDVDSSPPSTELTLEESIEYEKFLGKTVEPKSKAGLSIDKLDISAVEQDSRDLATPPSESEDLVGSVNTLIPLIVELLKYKLNDSTEAILQTVTPVLDQIIEQRSAEDSQKMAAAIAKILPSAITEEIHLSPEAIALAIAPELAIAIKEQIRLDENAISQALGSQMGKSIETQIELEEEAMVKALYPVIGNTISTYLVEEFQKINNKVEDSLSPKSIKRTIRAKIQGVSEAELRYLELMAKEYHVQAIFLIDKDSGLVIHEVQNPEDKHLDSDMIAGMLTAIRSFANDCIASGSELNSINYGGWQILIEVPGYCYLAVVYKGEPSKKFRNEIRRVLGKIVLNYGKEIKNFEGDTSTVPPEIRLLLEQLIQPEDHKSKKSSSVPILVWLLLLLLGMIFVPWGIINYRARVARNIERITATQLDAAPELSVYRLEPKVNKGKLTVTGRVPSQYLNNQAGSIIQTIANQNNLELDNQILTVNVPVNPSLYTGEIGRLTSLFNRQPGISIETDYEPTTLTIEGFILNSSDQQSISQAFRKIPGIEQIIFRVANKLPIVEQYIYFKTGSNRLNITDNSSKIEAVKQFLEQYPQLHLKLVAHSDSQGSIKINQKLRQERCQNVQAALVATGVNSNRLVTQCEQQHPLLNQDNQRLRPKRYVGFEPFIPRN